MNRKYNKLEEAARKFTDEHPFDFIGEANTEKAFIAGAEWQKRKDDEDHAAQLMLSYQKGYDDARRLHSFRDLHSSEKGGGK